MITSGWHVRIDGVVWNLTQHFHLDSGRGCPSRVAFPSLRKQGEGGGSGGFCQPCSRQGVSQVETLGLGWFIKLDHPRVFHESFYGQHKRLKGAEENQVEPAIVWADFVPHILWHSSSLWEQVAAAEEEQGQCSPTVFQVSSMLILLNALRVLGTTSTVSCTRAAQQHHPWYVLSAYSVCTSMYQHVLSMYQVMS